MRKDSKIFVAGHRGLVGSAILRELKSQGYENTVLRSHPQLDLTHQPEVEDFFRQERPQYVFLAAAKVGGILANSTYPADFIYTNLSIQTHVIHCSWKYGVEKLMFLGSSCIYPKLAPQPITESSLLAGPLEPTNEPYAIAKIAGLKMCQAYNEQYGTNFISVMPTNLYGPHDNFDLHDSHVLPALIRKFHEARENGDTRVVLCGTGSPRREFLHVDDLAKACLLLMDGYDSGEIINIGTGEDIAIRDLAELVRQIVGYHGEVVWDETKPDGTPQKLLDISKIRRLGWQPRIGLEKGIRRTYEWYCRRIPSSRK